jgi:pantetheine-phosphate adenylyltransferase
MYPGTFDPITRGHEDVIRRCARLFDRVVVAIAASPKKAPLLSLEERVTLAREVLRDMPQVSVVGYDALTVDFAREHGLSVIVRGLRSASDFEYEFQLATMNSHLDDNVETVLLTPTERFTFISATLVREIAEHGGDVSAFVHPIVERCLQGKFREAVRRNA